MKVHTHVVNKKTYAENLKFMLFTKGIPSSIGTRLMEYYRGGIDLSNTEAK